MHRPHVKLVRLLLCTAAALCGCSGYTGPRSVVNPDPAVKIPQIRKAVEAGDRSVIPQLIQDLDSNDAAVRFYAIEALQRLTDEDFEYDWTAVDRHVRAPAIRRWQKYLQDNPVTAKDGRP
jgi:nicotinamide mononucleotide adenylyltransferase